MLLQLRPDDEAYTGMQYNRFCCCLHRFFLYLCTNYLVDTACVCVICFFILHKLCIKINDEENACNVDKALMRPKI